MNSNKICPLMSNADKKVNCSDSCAFYQQSFKSMYQHECAFLYLANATNQIAEELDDILIKMPIEDD